MFLRLDFKHGFVLFLVKGLLFCKKIVLLNQLLYSNKFQDLFAHGNYFLEPHGIPACVVITELFSCKSSSASILSNVLTCAYSLLLKHKRN